MPDPQRLLNTLASARAAFWRTPGRQGRFTQLPEGVEVFIVGDMHGNVDNFRQVLQKAQLAQHPRRHLVVQELVHGPFRYPNGGDKSHQLLDLIAALKCQFPERVHYLLGNHELAQWQRQRIGKGDVDQNVIFHAGIVAAYEDAAERIVAGYDELFASLDVALRTSNRIFLSHTYPNLGNQSRFTVESLKKTDFAPEEVRLGGVIHSLVWNRDLKQATVESFLALVDADLIVTGHIPCDQGFMVPNDRQLILDALGTPACYCLFPTDRILTQQELLKYVLPLEG